MPKFEFSEIELECMSKHEWLTDREKDVFEMFYRRGLSIETIAANLDVNRSTINRILKSIRNKTIKSI